jgi:amino acid transporter
MQRLVGQPGVLFVGATVMLSTFGTINGSLLTAPRIFFAMAEDGLFFKPVAAVHALYRTPHVAVVLSMILGAVFISVGRFETLTNAFATALLPFYGLSVASVFIFRAREGRASRSTGPPRIAARTEGDELPPDVPESEEAATAPDRPPFDPPVRTPLYPVVPLIFIASTILLLTNAVLDVSSRVPTLITLAVVVAGVPVYFATVGRPRTGRTPRP